MGGVRKSFEIYWRDIGMVPYWDICRGITVRWFLLLFIMEKQDRNDAVNRLALPSCAVDCSWEFPAVFVAVHWWRRGNWHIGPLCCCEAKVPTEFIKSIKNHKVGFKPTVISFHYAEVVKLSYLHWAEVPWPSKEFAATRKQMHSWIFHTSSETE